MSAMRPLGWAMSRAMAFGAALFVLSVLLTKPFAEFVVLLNDWNTPKPPGVIGLLGFHAFIFGALWIASFAGFKMAIDDMIAAYRRGREAP